MFRIFVLFQSPYDLEEFWQICPYARLRMNVESCVKNVICLTIFPLASGRVTLSFHVLQTTWSHKKKLVRIDFKPFPVTLTKLPFLAFA